MKATPAAIYLDHAATTPLRESVRHHLVEMLAEPYGNPSSTHHFGRKARTVLEQARKSIAQCLHCEPGELIFTSGGTEADNMALRLSVRDLGIKRIITAPTEHHAILHPAEALEKEGLVQLELLRLNDRGEPDLQHLEELLRQGSPSLVSLMHGNNEIGNLLDLQAVGEIVHRYQGLFHSDTVQTIGHYPFDLKNGPVDMLSASAHKFYGPKGVGFLYLRSGHRMGSLITGGSQERNHRGGTENVPSISAMAVALEEAYRHLEAEAAHISAMKDLLQKSLQEHFPQVRFNGLSAEAGRSLYGVLSTRFPELKGDPALHLFQLDLRGLAVSGGSACGSGSMQGSHVIKALHPESEAPVIRFSPGKDTSPEEIEQALEILKDTLRPQAKGDLRFPQH